MKLSTITAAALCASVATAAPTWDDWSKKGKDASKKEFEFTSVYKVVATPDQVVNGSNVATGGLPVSANCLVPE